MSAMPVEMGSTAFDSPAPRDPFDHDAISTHEYTNRHRTAWLLLVRETGSETLFPRKLKSWVRLWGRLGAELFDRFWSGDRFVRSDMISLARREGGARGVVVARKLEEWRITEDFHQRIVSPENQEKTAPDGDRGSDACPATFDDLEAKLNKRFDRLEEIGRQMERALQEWGRRLEETEHRLSKGGWLPTTHNESGRRF